jgi:hypothetical protein
MKKLKISTVFIMVIILAMFCGSPFARAEESSEIIILRSYAELGDTEAQYLLGLAYSIGVILPQDYKQAIIWFRKAAEHGNAKAQYQFTTVPTFNR